MSSQFLTGVGRIVQGHTHKMSVPKDKRTGQPRIDKKTGQPRAPSLYFGVAFPKAEFEAVVRPWLNYQAQLDWPRGEHQRRDFAWKVIDGDGLDDDNKPYSTRVGFAGCFILKCSSNYAIKVVNGIDGSNAPIDETQIKCGDYVRVYVDVKGNAPSETAGLYINPQFVQLVGYGQAINNGPDVNAVLAAAGGFTLPPGATSMPPATTNVPIPAVPGNPVPQAQYVQQPAPPGYAPVSAPQPVMHAAPMAPVPPTAGLAYPPNPGLLVPPMPPQR